MDPRGRNFWQLATTRAKRQQAWKKGTEIQDLCFVYLGSPVNELSAKSVVSENDIGL